MRSLAIGFVCLLWLAPIAQQPPAGSTLTKYDRDAALGMLQQVKADLKEYYYDPAFRGMNVDEAFQRAEDRLKNATTLSQAIGLIAEVLLRLEDSHTVFIPPDRKARLYYGWRCEMIGEAPFVTVVASGSDAQKQGLKVGDRVLAWNEYAPSRANLSQIKYVYNIVRPQPRQHLVVRGVDGALKTLDIETRIETRDQDDLPDLIASLADLSEGVGDESALAGEILVWHYAGFGEARNIDKVMRAARAAKGLVIDLRGNGGGAVDALRAMVSWLFDRDVSISVEKTRRGDKPLMAKGRKDAYGGPLVVLVDSDSGSAAEIAARVVQLEQRGKVIGDRTAGAVMTSRLLPHVYGQATMTFYATSMTIGDVRMRDGSSLERVGVTPDEIALPSGADLAAGRDPVLARAVAVLGGTITAEQAGRLFK